MKRTVILLCVILISSITGCFISFPFLVARMFDMQSDEQMCEEATVVFPLSLHSVDDYAFAGTNINRVIFSDEIEYIGDYAFWNANGLKYVHIPESIRFIGTNAFPADTVIHGAENSYVETWAETHGCRFIVEANSGDRIMGTEIQIECFLILLCCVIPISDKTLLVFYRRVQDSIRSMRPQDRPELYPIDYRFP